jgi:hypothetical protein
VAAKKFHIVECPVTGDSRQREETLRAAFDIFTDIVYEYAKKMNSKEPAPGREVIADAVLRWAGN